MTEPTARTASHSLSLPPEPASAARARSWLREVLAPGAPGWWLDTAELAATELVTNAVLHAHTEVDLSVHVGADELLVEVTDGSPMLPVQRVYDSLSTTGRGMGLVAALSSDHGIRDAGPAGKTAWFVLRGDGSGPDEDDLLSAWDDGAWDEATRDAVLSAADGPDGGAPSLAVRLVGMPPTLWFAAREHHDALLRELALHLAGRGRPDVPVGSSAQGQAPDLAAADLARGTVSTALWALVDAARGHGPGTAAHVPGSVMAPVDLDVLVPEATVPAFARLQDTLDLAERLAASGELFTRSGLPEVVAVRDWACEQVLSQHAGAPPVPWGGVEQPRFLARDAVPGPGTADGWDLAPVREHARGVAAADDSNRIVAVSRPLARLLGWQVDDLVGQRIVVLVPPRLREAHVAGFTRHLATGEEVILGTPATLPVLAADGREIACRVLIEHAGRDERGGRYLAWIEAEPTGVVDA